MKKPLLVSFKKFAQRNLQIKLKKLIFLQRPKKTPKNIKGNTVQERYNHIRNSNTISDTQHSPAPTCHYIQ